MLSILFLNISNLSIINEVCSPFSLQLTRVLRNFNITKISDLELISNTTDRLDITFHFFGIKGDSQRIRDVITRMVERGRIGNFTLVSNYHHFDENPPLNMLVSNKTCKNWKNVLCNQNSPKFNRSSLMTHTHCHLTDKQGIRIRNKNLISSFIELKI